MNIFREVRKSNGEKFLLELGVDFKCGKYPDNCFVNNGNIEHFGYVFGNEIDFRGIQCFEEFCKEVPKLLQPTRDADGNKICYKESKVTASFKPLYRTNKCIRLVRESDDDIGIYLDTYVDKKGIFTKRTLLESVKCDNTISVSEMIEQKKLMDEYLEFFKMLEFTSRRYFTDEECMDNDKSQ